MQSSSKYRPNQIKHIGPKLSMDVCNIANLSFCGLRPTEYNISFRASALYASHPLSHHSRRISIPTRESGISCRALPPPFQALLHVLDVIQPATKWTWEERPNTITFTPLNVDYNSIRLQSMPCSLYLTHPDNPLETTRYLTRPSRLHSDFRGATYIGRHGGARQFWYSHPSVYHSPACMHTIRTPHKAISCRRCHGVLPWPSPIYHPPTP
jgi:hypothetical protein